MTDKISSIALLLLCGVVLPSVAYFATVFVYPVCPAPVRPISPYIFKLFDHG